MLSPSLFSVPSSQPHTATTAHSSSMFGNEEEEMDALLGEMMAAFPTQTTESECACYGLVSNVERKTSADLLKALLKILTKVHQQRVH